MEPLQHRFAYVGSDLQDLYGVRPATVVVATRLQDAWFAGGPARELIDRLARQPDGVLVSAETVHDFQLQPGDTLKLRLQDARTRRYIPVRFHDAGIVKEFPTVPRDGFLVANADYVARAAGSDAVDLAGLTRLELGFALVLAAAATGLVLALGLAERRRTFAIASALGARPRQLAAFVWAETAVVTVGGLAIGAVAGWVLSAMLVKVLSGVFDPPPATLAVPWAYLTVTVTVALAAVTIAGAVTVRAAQRPLIATLRAQP